MKMAGSLSGIALLSVLNVTPCFALSIQSNAHLSTQTQAGEPETIRLAGFFDVLDDAIDTTDDALDIVDQERRRQERREAQEQAEQRRQELEEARRAASEQERIEAENRQRHFDSLSREERQAYVNEQQSRQAEADAAAALFLLQIFSAGAEANASEPTSDDSELCQHSDPYSGTYYYEC